VARTRRLLAVLLGVLAVVLAITPVVEHGKPRHASAADTGRKTYSVGTRSMIFSRGPARSLPTLIWYPARGAGGAGAPPAEGRFPVLLYSHGLASLPIDHGQVAVPLAAAGFIVAAPTYPKTNKHVSKVDRSDVVNQPADASEVITEILRLGGAAAADGTERDPLAGHVDTTKIAAIGHSAGGTTTNGLLASRRDGRIKAGVVIAGRPMGQYAGPPAPMLFVHGDTDRVVTYGNGRIAYGRVPWPKAFLTLLGQRHGEYLGRGAPGNTQTLSTIVKFLRWALGLDSVAAREGLTETATLPEVTRFENELG
jgi:dienelactone hydrolase